MAELSGVIVRHGERLPATLAKRTKGGVEKFRGVVVDVLDSQEGRVEFCDHDHRYEDMAMTCARRLRAHRQVEKEVR